jgi:hypothetical protein
MLQPSSRCCLLLPQEWSTLHLLLRWQGQSCRRLIALTHARQLLDPQLHL